MKSQRKFSSDAETSVRSEVENIANGMLKRIYSSYTQESLESLLLFLTKLFISSYKKIIVNENQIEKLRGIF